MDILAIDPGPAVSGWVYYNTVTRIPMYFGIDNTQTIIGLMKYRAIDKLVIEKVGTQKGNLVGATIFDTCRAIGRIEQAFHRDDDVCYEIDRHAVIIHLYGFMRKRRPDKTWFKVKDKHINALLVERYGGQEKAIGGITCKKCKGKGWFGAGQSVCPACNGGKWLHPPGPLFGMKKHIFDAFGLAITFAEQYLER